MSWCQVRSKFLSFQPSSQTTKEKKTFGSEFGIGFSYFPGSKFSLLFLYSPFQATLDATTSTAKATTTETMTTATSMTTTPCHNCSRKNRCQKMQKNWP